MTAKALKTYKRPGKAPVWAELPVEVVTELRSLAQSRKGLRHELELAVRHWLSLPEPQRVKEIGRLAAEMYAVNDDG